MENKITLFKGEELHTIFRRNDTDFETLISNFTDDDIARRTLNGLTQEILARYSIAFPELQKKKTTTHIRSEKLVGHQLPAGTQYVVGKSYDIETAVYQLPFSGDGQIFFVKVNNSNLNSFTANKFIKRITAQGNTIICELTNWGTITGDDDVVDLIKNLFLQLIEAIETTLEPVKHEIEKYNETIAGKIATAYNNRMDKLNLKKSTKKNLNPFI